MSIEPALNPQVQNQALHRRVAPLCHIIRLCALAWISWATAATLMLFASPESVAAHYSRVLKVDLTSLPLSGYAMALAIIVFDLALAWLIVLFVWRLFGHYLKGDIFSIAAVTEMWRAGWTGVAAVVADIVARPLLAYVLTQHLSENQRYHFWTTPNDLLHFLLALFVVALAHIFSAGVEIADDNRQIV